MVYCRDLYELLDSPVLRNDDPDCSFFAWDHFGNEFHNVQSVFDMPETRIAFADNHTSSQSSKDMKVRNTDNISSVVCFKRLVITHFR